MASQRRIAQVLAAAFAFGLLAALAKGPGGADAVAETRSALGNLSTPWLLVAFLAGAACTRIRTGALVGLLATLVALLGFYLVSSLWHDLGASIVDDLRLELSANRGYLEGGLVSGPLFGAVGAWWRQRRTLGASVVAGALLMAEPIVLILLHVAAPGGVLSTSSGIPTIARIVPGWGLWADSPTITIVVYAAEFAIGLALVSLAAMRSARPARLAE